METGGVLLYTDSCQSWGCIGKGNIIWVTEERKRNRIYTGWCVR